MLKSLTVEKFIEELSSNSPTPGGGSTAALSASSAAALCSMVFNLTIGKKTYEAYPQETKEEIANALKTSNELKDCFLEIIDKDSEAFTAVMSAFKLPKDNEAEKRIREAAIENGYKKALEVPLELAVKAYNFYDCLQIAATYGNKNAISDAGVGALMLQAAIEGAVLNVKINLSGIKDEEYGQKIFLQCDTMIKQGQLKKESILEIVNSKI